MEAGGGGWGQSRQPEPLYHGNREDRDEQEESGQGSASDPSTPLVNPFGLFPVQYSGHSSFWVFVFC